jgi:hypothetical protein
MEATAVEMQPAEPFAEMTKGTTPKLGTTIPLR